MPHLGWSALLAVLLILLGCQPARAQYEFNAWRFGDGMGLTFPTRPGSGPPQAVSSRLFAIEGCASAADSAGNLLLYTDGEKLYNRLNQALPGGQLGPPGGTNAVQGVLLLKHPGLARRYLLFKIDEAQHLFVDGLRYVDILMDASGTNGQLLQPQLQRLTPPGYRVTEAMTAVRHANGSDYWVVVHEYLSREFLSYHLAPAGLDTVPVRSVVGSIHGFANPGVSMRASPDGRLLAASVPTGPVELFDFDNQTGRLANARAVPGSYGSYSLEFSPNGNLLYMCGSGLLKQADLRSSAAPTLVGTGDLGTVQRAPDGLIYVATHRAFHLGAITSPNTAGLACNFEANAVPLTATGAYGSLYGLPNFPNQPPSRLLRLLGSASGCAGQDVSFSADGVLVGSYPLQWNFGDPASGAANQASGSLVRHRYQLPGTYSVSLTVLTPAGPEQRSLLVRVAAPLSLHLRPRSDTVLTLCDGEAFTLRTNPQPRGSTFRWQNGSTDSVLLVRQPGRYTLEVRNAGCNSRDSVLVLSRACAQLPNIITPNGDTQNQTFVLTGLRAPEWSACIFNRWGRQVYFREPYDNTWSAEGQTAGIYYYLLFNRQTSQQLRGWVEVVR